MNTFFIVVGLISTFAVTTVACKPHCSANMANYDVIDKIKCCVLSTNNGENF